MVLTVPAAETAVVVGDGDQIVDGRTVLRLDDKPRHVQTSVVSTTNGFHDHILHHGWFTANF